MVNVAHLDCHAPQKSDNINFISARNDAWGALVVTIKHSSKCKCFQNQNPYTRCVATLSAFVTENFGETQILYLEPVSIMEML